ncbi:hypothetical protein HGRIS_000415 [Hohenbuehelia grisea]|uniref:DUF6533 domain-containing protein n=1 Tax=Hohenbuehelia grisea TaxID=104357 RepID=A0ABR3JT05_9AGAR
MAILVQDAAIFAQLLQAVSDVFAVNICTAAALAWLVYDILITFDQEVALLRARLTWSKCIHIFLRYWTVVILA